MTAEERGRTTTGRSPARRAGTLAGLLALVVAVLGAASTTPVTAAPGGPPSTVGRDTGTYRNPLLPRIPEGGVVESCADPVVLRGQQPGDRHWYLYCTTDPLNDSETAGPGPVTFHPIPMLRSRDLVDWTYVGDALPEPPSWAAPGAGIWAPDVVYSETHDRYYLTFVVTNTADSVSGEPGCSSDSAIGVATSSSPTGPWQVSDTPLVPPRRDGAGCSFFWTFDPDVLGDVVDDRGVLYYGSYYGGVFATRVSFSPDGMAATGEPSRIVIGNRYEGSNVVKRGPWYYYFGSATNCCNGPLTGYSVFVARSRSPFGPFVDREGNSLLAGRVGGTPALSMNGNRWVGLGHNSTFEDLAGQWWTAYHAVDRHDPYFESEPGFTKRPVLLDPVDWVDGWPTVRAGRWASDQPMPAPAAQPGQRSSYVPDPVAPHLPGEPLPSYSDDFEGSTLDPAWSWVREPEPGTYRLGGGTFSMDTQAADLHTGSNNASVLTRPEPEGDYVVDTRVRLDLPPEGCCHNYVQAGLVLYGGDDAFIKLTHVSIWETRQTEFAKEVPDAPAGYPRYGNTVVGAPDEWTWLRVVKEERSGEDHYTAYTSQDGESWVRGGTWTHELGDGARIGLVSMGGRGFTASFDHVRVSRLG